MASKLLDVLKFFPATCFRYVLKRWRYDTLIRIELKRPPELNEKLILGGIDHT